MGSGTLGIAMLNPSKADEHEDDPTIRRCKGFAEAGGYRYLLVANLFGYRATMPRTLLSQIDELRPWLGSINPSDPTAGELSAWTTLREEPTVLVCAWGAHSGPLGRAVERRAACFLEHLHGTPLFVLGLSRNGHPRHPLYLRKTATPTPWEGAQAYSST